MAQAWPSFLWVVAATVFLADKAPKIILRQALEVFMSHQVASLLAEGPHWMTALPLPDAPSKLESQLHAVPAPGPRRTGEGPASASWVWAAWVPGSLAEQMESISDILMW